MCAMQAGRACVTTLVHQVKPSAAHLAQVAATDMQCSNLQLKSRGEPSIQLQLQQQQQHAYRD